MTHLFYRKVAFLAVGVTAVMVCAALLLRHAFRQATDLGAVPPEQTFTRVFKMPVPNGVSQLKIAGEAHWGGVVWMRFQVADINAFLQSLRKHGIVLEPAYELWIRPEGIRNSHYAAKVEWERALQLASPRYYRFSMQPPGTGWAGELLIDSQQKTIYLRGDLL